MRSTSSRSLTKTAAQSAGHCALYVVAPIDPLRPELGKNKPLSPIRFGITENPRNIGNLASQWNWVEVALVAVVWTNSRRDADRLREKLESLILADERIIRGSWYDIDLPDLVELIDFAAMLTNVETFSDADRRERLEAVIAATLKGKRQRVGRFV